MNTDKNCSTSERSPSLGNIRIQLTDPMLYDRLHTLSAEYSVSVNLLVNEAIKRLLADVDFVRSLRTGKMKGA